MGAAAARTFEISDAKLERVPLLVGLVGPSFSGKTYSALRLAVGIQVVTGGDIVMIDTEARRGLHYAKHFKFRHLPFKAPFGSLDYLAAIETAVAQGARVVVIDSMSHEHEGPGGVLEQHETELDRLAGDDWGKRERCNMLAWAKPKQARRRLINSIVQMQIAAVFCFRAKEKIKLPEKGDKDREPKSLGWMAIAGDEFIYEMTASALLYPGAAGVPTWNPKLPGEKLTVKIPEQFRSLFNTPLPLCEQMGTELARWAEGTEAAKPPGDPKLTAELLGYLREAGTRDELEEIRARLSAGKVARVFSGAEMRELAAAVKACEESLPAEDEAPEPGSDG